MTRFFHLIKKPQQLLLLIALVSYIIICWLTPDTGFTADLNCWRMWSEQMCMSGPAIAYHSGVNYLPLYLYFLYIYSLFQTSIQGIADHLTTLKYITLLFDVAGALMIVSFVTDRKMQIIFFLCLFFNIAYLYNTVIWGQIDAIHTTLLLAALYFALKTRLTASSLFFTLAFCMKFQAVIYFPIFFLLWLPELMNKKDWKFISSRIVLNLLVILLVFSPFIIDAGIGYTFGYVKNMIATHSNVISKSAFNFWELLINGPLFNISDEEKMLGLSAKLWGTILSLLFLVATIIPVLNISLNPKKHGALQNHLPRIFLSLGLTTLVFFYFKTGMHERYAHSALIFMAGYAFLSYDFIPYLLNSIAYFFQLNTVMTYAKYDSHMNFMVHKELTSVLFLITIGYSFYKLYATGKYAPINKYNIGNPADA